jgi:hypothetical protein
MYSISFFSRFVFDEFIVKGEEYGHKVGRTLANQVDERRNMIMTIQGGELTLRVLGGLISEGVLILNFSCFSELFLALSCHFGYLCHFSCLLLAFTFILLLNDLLEFFLAFWVF